MPPRVSLLPPATPEQAEDERRERAAIAAEGPLPALGTAERTRLDQRHAATPAGLLAVAGRDWRGVGN